MPSVKSPRLHGAGPNALDFHIAYYIGVLSAELPGAAFHIFSKDTGFDPLIKHLQAKNINCRRVTALADILPPPPPASSDDRVQKVADRLLNLAKGRPRTLKRLTAFIKAHLNSHATQTSVNEVISLLKRGRVSIPADGKVAYPPA